jgi:hypothetical protein
MRYFVCTAYTTDNNSKFPTTSQKMSLPSFSTFLATFSFHKTSLNKQSPYLPRPKSLFLTFLISCMDDFDTTMGNNYLITNRDVSYILCHCLGDRSTQTCSHSLATESHKHEKPVPTLRGPITIAQRWNKNQQMLLVKTDLATK